MLQTHNTRTQSTHRDKRRYPNGQRRLSAVHPMFTVKPLTPVRTPADANVAPRVKVARAPSAIRLLRPLPRIVLTCCLPRARAVGLEARTRAVVVLVARLGRRLGHARARAVPRAH